MTSTPTSFLRRTLTLSLLSLLALAPRAASAAKPKPPVDHWVGTWSTASYGVPNPGGHFGAPGTAGTTLREIVHVSLGGPMVRVTLSNEYGTDPLIVGAAHAALSAGGSAVKLPSASALTFHGQPSVTLVPGTTATSDPFALTLPAGADLAISLFLPDQPVNSLTFHPNALQTSFYTPGNGVGRSTLAEAQAARAPQPTGATAAPQALQTIHTWDFLKSVDVLVPAHDAAIVAFGDSITDGTYSTADTNNRWPDIFARRLQADKRTAGLGVLNEGIGGNRILHDNTGPSALARFDRDVLNQSGVKYVIVLESINDIGHAADPVKPYDVVSAEDLIAGFKQMVERAHAHGIKIYGATLTPYVGAKYSSPAGETIREAVNQFIRTGKVFDGVIDFDAATHDPANPGTFLPAYDHGDHLHPTDAGMKAMADSIDLGLFVEK